MLVPLLLLAQALEAGNEQQLRDLIFDTEITHPLTHVACDRSRRLEVKRQFDARFAKLRKKYLREGGAPRREDEIYIHEEAQHFHCSYAKIEAERDRDWVRQVERTCAEYDRAVRLFREWEKARH